MPIITIRPYQADDLSRLVAVFRASVRRGALGDYTEAQVRAWAPDLIDHEQFGQRCAAKSTWIAEVEGSIAGFSDLEPDGHVDMLYVDPRFQRHGVARALLSHIEQLARERALELLYTEASITARPTFEAMGYRVLAAQTVTVRGESVTNYRMEKCLTLGVRAVLASSGSMDHGAGRGPTPGGHGCIHGACAQSAGPCVLDDRAEGPCGRCVSCAVSRTAAHAGTAHTAGRGALYRSARSSRRSPAP